MEEDESQLEPGYPGCLSPQVRGGIQIQATVACYELHDPLCLTCASGKYPVHACFRRCLMIYALYGWFDVDVCDRLSRDEDCCIQPLNLVTRLQTICCISCSKGVCLQHAERGV